MSTVTLQTLWLSPIYAPLETTLFPYMTALSRSRDVDGARRVYGNGRLRSTSSSTATRDWSVTLPALTRVQITWLEEHVGVPLCARDDRGNLIFCVYYSAPVDEHQYNEEGNSALKLVEISYPLNPESDYPVGPS